MRHFSLNERRSVKWGNMYRSASLQTQGYVPYHDPGVSLTLNSRLFVSLRYAPLPVLTDAIRARPLPILLSLVVSLAMARFPSLRTPSGRDRYRYRSARSYRYAMLRFPSLRTPSGRHRYRYCSARSYRYAPLCFPSIIRLAQPAPISSLRRLGPV